MPGRRRRLAWRWEKYIKQWKEHNDRNMKLPGELNVQACDARDDAMKDIARINNCLLILTPFYDIGKFVTNTVKQKTLSVGLPVRAGRVLQSTLSGSGKECWYFFMNLQAVFIVCKAVKSPALIWKNAWQTY